MIVGWGQTNLTHLYFSRLSLPMLAKLNFFKTPASERLVSSRSVSTRDTPYSRSVIPLFSCPLSWSVHYNFSGDGSCRIMMEAVVPSWKLSRLLTVAMSKQDFSARKPKCNFFIMVYKSLLTNVFTWFCLILNKICGRKSATWPWHTAASPNPIRQVR